MGQYHGEIIFINQKAEYNQFNITLCAYLKLVINYIMKGLIYVHMIIKLYVPECDQWKFSPINGEEPNE